MAKRVNGGPRRGPRNDTDARADILAAALREFAERGYRDATMRSIALEAGVDAKLVHYYFGTKEALFTTAIGSVFRPGRIGDLLAARDPDADEGVGTALVTMVLALLEDESSRAPFLGVLRNLGTHEASRAVFLRFVTTEIIERVAPQLPGDDGELRVSLVGSQLLGLAMARYVVEVPALVAASPEQLARALGPTVDRYLFGSLDSPGATA